MLGIKGITDLLCPYLTTATKYIRVEICSSGLVTLRTDTVLIYGTEIFVTVALLRTNQWLCHLSTLPILWRIYSQEQVISVVIWLLVNREP